MKLAILGATSSIGVEMVRCALYRGEQVTILTEEPSKFEIKDYKLRKVRGNVYSVSDIQKAIHGSDAVLSALNHTNNLFQSRRETTFYSETIKYILKAMEKEGIKRLIAITSNYVEKKNLNHSFFSKLMKGPIYKDMNKMEELIQNETKNGLKWTIVRPSCLTNEKSRDYRVNNRLNPEKGWMITRIDTAKFVVEEAFEGRWVHKYPTLAI